MMRSISQTKSQSSATMWRITTLRGDKVRRDSCPQEMQTAALCDRRSNSSTLNTPTASKPDPMGTQMAHQRVRKFNTRDTYPEQKLDNDFCQVVVAKGTMVFVRGQIGQDLATSKSVGIGDVAAQTDQAMKNIKMLLEETGSSLQPNYKITLYIIDPRYLEAVYRVVGGVAP